MAYGKTPEKTPTRQLRKKTPRKPLEFSVELHTMVQTLLCIAEEEDVGVYLGPTSTTGGKKIKFYMGDEVLEDYIGCADDPLELGVYIADQVFGAQAAKRIERILGAMTPQEPPRATERPAPNTQAKKLRPEAPEGS